MSCTLSDVSLEQSGQGRTPEYPPAAGAAEYNSGHVLKCDSKRQDSLPKIWPKSDSLEQDARNYSGTDLGLQELIRSRT